MERDFSIKDQVFTLRLIGHFQPVLLAFFVGLVLFVVAVVYRYSFIAFLSTEANLTLLMVLLSPCEEITNFILFKKIVFAPVTETLIFCNLIYVFESNKYRFLTLSNLLFVIVHFNREFNIVYTIGFITIGGLTFSTMFLYFEKLYGKLKAFACTSVIHATANAAGLLVCLV